MFPCSSRQMSSKGAPHALCSPPAALKTNQHLQSLCVTQAPSGTNVILCNFTISVLGYTYTQNIPKQLYKWIHLLALPPLRQQQCSQSSDVKPHAPIGFAWLPWSRQRRHIFPLPFQIHPNHLGQIPGHFRQLWTCCQAAAAVWESRDWSSSTSFALRCRSWSES